jgi:opacity protein-like surface antigen
MTTLRVTAVAAAALMLAVLPARAVYVQAGGGVSFDPSLSYGTTSYPMNTGWNVTGSAGFDLPLGFALQGDAFYNDSQYSCCKSSLSSLSLTGDLLYNIPTGTPFTPYFGAGVGAADTRYRDPTAVAFDGDAWTFAYQAIGGVRWQFAPLTSLFAEYRFQNAGDVTIKGEPHVGNESNNATFGVRLDL